MNISPDGVTVRFKTKSEDLFMAEKTGAKPNTVRIIAHYERQQLKKKLPQRIIIQHRQELILRTVTHVYVSEMILGKHIAIFSWTNEDHHHPPTLGPHSVPVEPGPHNVGQQEAFSAAKSDSYAHNMSVDEMPGVSTSVREAPYRAITVSLTLRKKLDALRGSKTYDELIKEFVEQRMDDKSNFHVHTVDYLTTRIIVPSIPIAKTKRCSDCDGDLLESRAGEFGKCASCQALYYFDLESQTKQDALLPVLLPRTLIHDLIGHRHGKGLDEFIQELLETYLVKLAEDRGPIHD